MRRAGLDFDWFPSRYKTSRDTLMRRNKAAALDRGGAARLSIRANKPHGPTAGLAPGYVQGNLAILAERLAGDFLRFCQLNPKPCPLIGTHAPGDPGVP